VSPHRIRDLGAEPMVMNPRGLDAFVAADAKMGQGSNAAARSGIDSDDRMGRIPYHPL
jgi:hypothetical protein